MERGVKKRVVLAVSLIVLVTAAFFVFSFSDSNLEPKFSNNTNISLTNDSTLSSAAVNIQPLSLEIENKTPILNQTNSSVTKKKSGGGGGGGSGGSSSGSGITGGVVLGNDSLGQGQQSSGEPSGESSSSLDSQNSGSSKISGRAIGEDLPLGKISIFGIIFIIVCLIVFILYKIFHHSSVMNVSNKKVAANI